jgi:hypothetical protein
MLYDIAMWSLKCICMAESACVLALLLLAVACKSVVVDGSRSVLCLLGSQPQVPGARNLLQSALLLGGLLVGPAVQHPAERHLECWQPHLGRGTGITS